IQSINTARNLPGVSVISLSWDFNEFAGETSYDQYFTTPPGHTGITFVDATGDSGAPGYYPAYCPTVLAVGGTQLTVDAAGDYVSETGWSDGGGGLSPYESQPTYQGGLVSGSTARAIPDVSINAAKPVAVYDSYDDPNAPWSAATGTSFSAPA